MIQTFITKEGIPVSAVTAEQMREIDRMAMQEDGPNLFQMMENAGRTLAMHVMDMLGEKWKTSKILILAGTGGNGGGGICAARHLVNRGVDVKVALTSVEKLKSVPAFQLAIYQKAGGDVIQTNQLKEQTPKLIVDSLIGYSLKGAPAGGIREMMLWANQSDSLRLSLDIPSGVDATSGETIGEFFHAHRTLTLALPKTGLTSDKAGELYLADIGIPGSIYKKAGIEYQSPFQNSFDVQIKAIL
jgi:NAD(P)H-hydrate epimerase